MTKQCRSAAYKYYQVTIIGFYYWLLLLVTIIDIRTFRAMPAKSLLFRFNNKCSAQPGRFLVVLFALAVLDPLHSKLLLLNFPYAETLDPKGWVRGFRT